MLRKTTAVTFMLVMTLLITLKHPVLGYCLCLDSYFAGDCVCQAEETPVTSDIMSTSCCSSCQANEVAEADSEPIPTVPSPCDDCTEHLNVDVDDFVWESTDQVPDNAETLIPFPAYLATTTLQIPNVPIGTTMQIRGSPPFRWQNIPIYLRHSVLIL